MKIGADSPEVAPEATQTLLVEARLARLARLLRYATDTQIALVLAASGFEPPEETELER